jgi:hypothetical protein
LLDLLGERERGKAKEIQHKPSQKRGREGTLKGAARAANKLPLRLRSTGPRRADGRLHFPLARIKFATDMIPEPVLRGAVGDVVENCDPFEFLEG